MQMKKPFIKKLAVGICGASGYTGMELLRLLALHPRVQVTAITSEKSAGKDAQELFPFLSSYAGLAFEALDREKLRGKDWWFYENPSYSKST